MEQELLTRPENWSPPMVFSEVRENFRSDDLIITDGTYPWSFVTQKFRSGQPSHGGDCKTLEVMTLAQVYHKFLCHK
jgi:hypothetical protein